MVNTCTVPALRRFSTLSTTPWPGRPPDLPLGLVFYPTLLTETMYVI